MIIFMHVLAVLYYINFNHSNGNFPEGQVCSLMSDLLKIHLLLLYYLEECKQKRKDLICKLQ